MKIARLPQKLITFADKEYEKIENEVKQGWHVVSLVSNGNYYLCILEKQPTNDNSISSIYIPPRKKIKIHSN